MRGLRRKAAATALAVSLGSTTLATLVATPASAAVATITCSGVTNDVAGSVAGANKSSADLLGLLSSLTGGSSELTLGVNVTPDVPASVPTGSDPFDAKFDFVVTLPPSLVSPLQTVLGKTSLKVTNATFAVNASGAATTTLSSTTPEINLALGGTVIVNQSITGTVTPEKAGLITYRPGIAGFSAVVDASVAGVANIGTITVTCTGTGVLGSTSVKPAGAPTITDNPISYAVFCLKKNEVDLETEAGIIPDDENPILWDSLKIVSPPAAGTASLTDGILTFDAPTAGGTYEVGYEVCAAERTIDGAEGKDEVQTLTFADTKYPGAALNTHPLYFTLTFDGETTRPIPMSEFKLFDVLPVAVDDPDGFIWHGLFGKPIVPSAATVRAALEALPNVDPGEIVVGGGPTSINDLSTPYTFTFAAGLGRTDVPQVTVEDWKTWLPGDVLEQIISAASGLGGGGGGSTPEPPTYEQSFQQLFGSTPISIDQFWKQIGDRFVYEIMQGIDIPTVLDGLTKLFPKAPTTATTVAGEEDIAPSSTGPLCAQGVVQFVVPGAAATTTTTTAPASTTTTTAKVAGTTATRSSGATAGSSRTSVTG
ncbi:MAG TPA: hypothetical protein PKA24_00475 [Microthrixaceae bacterium]|nr:hypothetical protein [Microthrixaceae bacterium]